MREEYYAKPKVWTNHEIRALWECRADGMTMLEVADRLDRSHRSVRAMYARMSKKSHLKLPTPPPIIETMAIPKDSVPEFYILGWRFVGFSADRLCIMRKERAA